MSDGDIATIDTTSLGPATKDHLLHLRPPGGAPPVRWTRLTMRLLPLVDVVRV
jgi:hypothetical protein